MRTVYVGSSAFAAVVLERLAKSAHRPSLVVTRPPRPRGRGRQSASPPIVAVAAGLGIEVCQPAELADAENLIAAADPAVVCVCAYGRLIREPLLSRYEMLNVHPSLLPRWRGAAPVERAIMAGDTGTGISIMRVTSGLDSGPVCQREREPIASRDTYGSLSARLEVRGGELLVAALDGSRTYVDQDEAHATYAEKIGPEDRRLAPVRTAVELDRVVRALHPHVGAWIDDRLRVHEARPADAPAALGPGELAAADGRLLYGCAGGALELLRVQRPGGRPMDAEDFLRGHAL